MDCTHAILNRTFFYLSKMTWKCISTQSLHVGVYTNFSHSCQHVGTTRIPCRRWVANGVKTLTIEHCLSQKGVLSQHGWIRWFFNKYCKAKDANHNYRDVKKAINYNVVITFLLLLSISDKKQLREKGFIWLPVWEHTIQEGSLGQELLGVAAGMWGFLLTSRQTEK